MKKKNYRQILLMFRTYTYELNSLMNCHPKSYKKKVFNKNPERRGDRAMFLWMLTVDCRQRYSDSNEKKEHHPWMKIWIKIGLQVSQLSKSELSAFFRALAQIPKRLTAFLFYEKHPLRSKIVSWSHFTQKPTRTRVYGKFNRRLNFRLCFR